MRRFFIFLGLTFALTSHGLAQVDIGFGGAAYDASQPIEATSDNLTVDQTTGEALFTGNVVIIQGDLRLSAPSVRVTYETAVGRRDVQQVVATGGVLITQGADAAEGSRARFDVASSLLYLNGDVLVTQGQIIIAGDSMVVDMETGDGSVDGRVRTILSGE